jgi:hypothetical protein
MRKLAAYSTLILIAVISLSAQEIIQVAERIDLSARIEKNDVIVPMSLDFDTDGRYIYIPEIQTATILKIEIASGRLVKTISRMGQGPGELLYPGEIVVQNQKIFVYDQRSRKIKIFSSNGEFQNEILTGSGVLGMDVTAKGEIFVFEVRSTVSPYMIYRAIENAHSLKLQSKPEI